MGNPAYPPEVQGKAMQRHAFALFATGKKEFAMKGSCLLVCTWTEVVARTIVVINNIYRDSRGLSVVAYRL